MKKIIIVLFCLFLCTSCKKEIVSKRDDLLKVDYSEAERLDINLYAKEYLLIRLNDLKVLYASNNANRFYPASLTKLITLDTVLNNESDLSNVSSISEYDRGVLINQNASLANIKANRDYTLKDLLYALILPSGADGGSGLDNYFDNELIALVNMNRKNLEMNDSNFTNLTGLHDDNLYTTLDDLLKVVLDILTYEDGKEILTTTSYYLDDGLRVSSTLTPLLNNEIEILGGKTGYTPEAGQNVVVLYKVDNFYYMLMLGGCEGNQFRGESFHFDDVRLILDTLYN